MLRVAFFGQSGPYSPRALGRLALHGRGVDVALVVQSVKRAGMLRQHVWSRCGPTMVGDRRRVALRIGAATDLQSLTQVAHGLGVDVLQTASVNAKYVQRVLLEQRIDILVCCGFNQIFAPQLLAVTANRAVNAHPSALPEGRGPAPLFWALRKAATATAMTLHRMDAQADSGPILAQQKFDIPARIAGDDLFSLAGILAGDMLVEVLKRAAMDASSGPADLPEGVAQAPKHITFAPRPGPMDACIEPSQWDCEALVNFACGAAYFRAAWVRLAEVAYHVRTGLRAMPGTRLPGEHVLLGDTLFLQCRDGAAVLEVQS